MSTVTFSRRTRKSGRVLQRSLNDAGYDGPNINFGSSEDAVEGLNSSEAIKLSAHKKRALEKMGECDVPIPTLYTPEEAREAVNDTPLVGRKNYHSKGREFYLCATVSDVDQAISRGATHFMEYIDEAREFRVNVVNGKSIKISEKVGGGNFANGATFQYPHDFNHKKSIRGAAKKAVDCLGLDFAAVDVLWREGKTYVLECNTAMRLIDSQSDTLERYIRAFMEYDSTS